MAQVMKKECLGEIAEAATHFHGRTSDWDSADKVARPESNSNHFRNDRFQYNTRLHIYVYN